VTASSATAEATADARPRATPGGPGQLSGVAHLVRVSWAFARRDLQIALTYRFNLLGRALGALFAVAMLSGLSRLVSPGGVSSSPYLAAWGGQYLPYVLPGLVLADLSTMALRLFAEKLHESQTYGTLEAELNTPTPALWVVLCAPLYQLFAGLGRAVVYLVGGALLFGIRYPGVAVGWAVLAALLTVLAYVALGIASAAFTLTLKRGDPVTMVISALTLLTGGVLFPVAVLPSWVHPLAHLAPASHGLEVMRAALLGHGVAGYWGHLVTLLGLSVVGLPVAVLLFGRALARARSDGSLGFY
jgi:ABC-2 type transport system permease protein